MIGFPSSPTITTYHIMEILKALFTSRTRVKLLTVFMQNPDGEYFIRELTRMLDEQINSVRRELDSLKKIGLLRSKAKNRKKYYVVNKNFIIFNELSSMIAKSSHTDDELIKKIMKIGEIEVMVFSGIFIGKQSSCDLFIVGNVDRQALSAILDESAPKQEAVKFSIMSKDDFLYRIKCNDKFIRDMVDDGANIVPVNKLTKELEKY